MSHIANGITRRVVGWQRTETPALVQTALCGLAVAISAGLTSAASAVECNAVEPALVNPIYGAGGSATRPYIKELAKALANQTPARSMFSFRRKY